MKNIVIGKLTVVLLAALLLISLLFIRNCEASQVFNIAIVQHQHYPDYQKAHDSFILSLNRKTRYSQATGNGETLFQFTIVEDFNADGNINLLNEKIKKITSRNDINLIFSIGTHSTVRLIKATKKTPIIFTMVSDPVNANIISDWKTSNSNFTGVEMPQFFSKAIELLYKVEPFKKLGMIYLKGSPSHEAGIKQIIELSKKLKFEFYYDGFELRKDGEMRPRNIIRAEIKNTLKDICPKVDAFFVQSSNTFSQEFDLFREAFVEYKILSSGDSVNIKKGLAIGINKDYTRFGEQCAEYAFDILTGKDPKTLPMDIGKKITIDINIKSFTEVNREPSFNLITGSDNVYY